MRVSINEQQLLERLSDPLKLLLLLMLHPTAFVRLLALVSVLAAVGFGMSNDPMMMGWLLVFSGGCIGAVGLSGLFRILMTG